MATYEITGTVIKVSDTQTFPSGFQKREFVIKEEADEYPQELKFVLFKDKCGLVDSLADNERLTVSFNLKGNEYNGKYYVDLNAWRIDRLYGEAVGGGEVEPDGTGEVDDLGDGDDSKLPF